MFKVPNETIRQAQKYASARQIHPDGHLSSLQILFWLVIGLITANSMPFISLINRMTRKGTKRQSHTLDAITLWTPLSWLHN